MIKMGIQKQDIRILLVDDAPPVMLEGLSAMLGVLGYSRIEKAANGNEALDVAKTYLPNLVLMDTRMPPGPEGYEVCRQMRQEPYGSNVAIIGMSNNEDPTIKEAWMGAGADDFFIKDTRLTDLDAIISAALEKYQH